MAKPKRRGRKRSGPPKQLDRRLRGAMVAKSIPGIEAGDMLVVLSSVELPGFSQVRFYEPLAPILFLFAGPRG
jgi:hypothetical protein